jgi:hypothetical protein
MSGQHRTEHREEHDHVRGQVAPPKERCRDSAGRLDVREAGYACHTVLMFTNSRMPKAPSSRP